LNLQQRGVSAKSLFVVTAGAAFASNLVTAHGGLLVFLQFGSEAVEFGCYCSVCLGNVIFEGRVPAKKNQGRDDQNFSQ
jgi:hypothetical protein